MTTQQEQSNIHAELERARANYSGESFARLTPASQLLTSVSWDKYPTKAFSTLVEAVREFSPQLADLLQDKGISYEVLGRGDRTRSSRFEIQALIACDTEDWYMNIPSEKRFWMEDDELNAQVFDAISSFEFDICQEVEKSLAAMGISVQEIIAELN